MYTYKMLTAHNIIRSYILYIMHVQLYMHNMLRAIYMQRCFPDFPSFINTIGSIFLTTQQKGSKCKFIKLMYLWPLVIEYIWSK